MFFSGRLGSAKLRVGLDELRVLWFFFNLNDSMILNRYIKLLSRGKNTLMFKTCFESVILSEYIRSCYLEGKEDFKSSQCFTHIYYFDMFLIQTKCEYCSP